jgi:hypothetical protein
LVRVIALLGSDLENSLGVGDFPVALNWDLVMQDGEEGVVAFDSFAVVGTSANAFA